MRKYIGLMLTFITVAVCAATGAAAAEKEPVYDRIIRTKELRCGYVDYPPLSSKDPNTGVFSGIGVDIMKRVTELLQVKLVWSEETSWATYIEGLNTGRYDALCTLDFFVPVYVGRLDITAPLFFSGIGVYKRANDKRFPEGFRDFNNPNVTISSIDGSLSMLIKESDYPRAKLLSMPNMSDYSFTLENVADGKADVTFVERSFAVGYMKKNPGKLVDIAQKQPLRIYPYFIPVKQGGERLHSALNGIIALMTYNGEIEKILQAHGDAGRNYYLPARPYQ